MRSNFKTWGSGSLIAIVTLYLLFIPLDTTLYDLLLFPCPDTRIVNLNKQFASLKASQITKKDVILVSANGKHLHGWFLELPGTQRVFLYSHSKGNNIYGKLNVAQALLACGGSVLMYDYQGYGQSEGRASIQNACDDGIAAYDYLIKEQHRKPKDIIGVGESLGSGVTGQLVTKRTLGGVIFLSGFASIKKAGENSLLWLKLYPDWCFPEQTMDNIAVFAKPHPPLLISHGTNDKVVRYEDALELYTKAIPPKTFLTIQGSGHGAVGKRGEFYTAIRKFLHDNNL